MVTQASLRIIRAARDSRKKKRAHKMLDVRGWKEFRRHALNDGSIFRNAPVRIGRFTEAGSVDEDSGRRTTAYGVSNGMNYSWFKDEKRRKGSEFRLEEFKRSLLPWRSFIQEVNGFLSSTSFNWLDPVIETLLSDFFPQILTSAALFYSNDINSRCISTAAVQTYSLRHITAETPCYRTCFNVLPRDGHLHHGQLSH